MRDEGWTGHVNGLGDSNRYIDGGLFLRAQTDRALGLPSLLSFSFVHKLVTSDLHLDHNFKLDYSNKCSSDSHLLIILSIELRFAQVIVIMGKGPASSWEWELTGYLINRDIWYWARH